MLRVISLAFASLVACAAKPTSTTEAESPPVTPPPTEDEDGNPSSVDGDSGCTKEECGPAMGMPNSMCPDGKTVAGPACRRNAEGKCGYEVVECPG